ncbi:MAG: STAS domain-containing protein [Bacteroidota bacterium]
MKFKIDKEERYTVFHLLEENLNSTIAPQVKSEFVLLNNEGTKNLILDLSAVKYVDSSGLSAILTANRLWKGDNGSFVLTGIVNENVKKLITISRVDTVLTILPTVQESIDDVLMDELNREFGKDADAEEMNVNPDVEE